MQNESESQPAQPPQRRAALFVDGFNLYHSVAEIGADFLKWANLWALGELIIPSRSEKLVSVDFCTAFYPGDFSKRIRHEAYNKALRLVGATVHSGHYISEPRQCPACSHQWERPTEKQTDINVALSVFDAARRDACDHAYLVSADSDQAATVEWFKSAFPQKDLTVVIPPIRPGSKEIRDRGGKPTIRLTRAHFERTLFGAVVTDGTETVMRPREYDPPKGWTPPAPKAKPPPPPKKWGKPVRARQ